MSDEETGGHAMDHVDVDESLKDAVNDGPLDGTELEDRSGDMEPEEEGDEPDGGTPAV